MSDEGGTVKVTGVEIAASMTSTRHTVRVEREVILAAGALHTPQLLQISGIGDPALLKTINVTTIVDLPAVGHNLHDHVSVFVVNIGEFPSSGPPLRNAKLTIGRSQYYTSYSKYLVFKRDSRHSSTETVRHRAKRPAHDSHR
jgi:choline dehydrogenase-like flavoprotein